MAESPPVAPVYSTIPPQPPVGANGLGLAGFITSLVGLIACGGVLSPIGLILSLVALGREPRGFAIAGVVLGLVGTAWLLIVIFVIGIGAVLAVIGLGVMAAVASKLGANAKDINDAVADYFEANGRVPAALSVLTTLSPQQLKDPWGNPFIYVPDGVDAFYLRTSGKDGVPNTSDDIEEWRRLGANSDIEIHTGRTTAPATAPANPSSAPATPVP